jgi:hypothetical protein
MNNQMEVNEESEEEEEDDEEGEEGGDWDDESQEEEEGGHNLSGGLSKTVLRFRFVLVRIRILVRYFRQ